MLVVEAGGLHLRDHGSMRPRSAWAVSLTYILAGMTSGVTSRYATTCMRDHSFIPEAGGVECLHLLFLLAGCSYPGETMGAGAEAC